MDPVSDRLVRALRASPEVRADDLPESLGVLTGHFCVWNRWTEINSWSEGRFLERIAPGAADKSVTEHFAAKEQRIKCQFNHGGDPQIGDKLLGPIIAIEADDVGARYEVNLQDTSYNRDLLPGLTAGLYGASFMFRVVQDSWNDEPGRSDHNPEGLPERTITEFRLFEFGPVTWPAYADASAGMRSLTDEWLERTLTPDRLAALRQTGTPDGAADATPPGAGIPPTEPPAGHSSRHTTAACELQFAAIFP